MTRARKKKPAPPSAPTPSAEPAELRVLPGLKTWHTSVLALALAAAAFTWLARAATRDPGINFLPRRAGAEWILFPRAVDASAHRVASLDTVFRREFDLDGQPQAARLDLRAAKRADVSINGTPVPVGNVASWKEVSSMDVAASLRTGRNRIDVTVLNDTAPPALWLTLTTDRVTVRSDEAWDASYAGSAWRHAALAAAPALPGPGNPTAGGERVFGALRATWLIWLMFAGIAAVICGLGPRWLGRVLEPAAGGGLSRRQTVALLSVIGGSWVLLFWHNAALMPYLQGFDSHAHLAYIKYVQERHALPWPTEGIEMFQPPLYYVVSAVALSVTGSSADAPSGIVVLRALTGLFGLLQFTVVFLSVRLCFPNRIAAQLAGLGLAAFLPMQLYLSHYVTNETLAALLATTSVYLGLRVLRAKDPPVSQFAWLGLSLGAAMLTKATAILLVLPLWLAVAIALAARRAPAAVWLRHLGTLSLVLLATCGWHYARIWNRFGTPLVGNWDPTVGFAWWQDPGFHTVGDYTRFGRSLVSPLFSGFAGFADGIYSTLWGDGLCGGVGSLTDRPPWNYDLMAAGYLLALVPTLLIFTGVAAAGWRFVRKPSVDWFVLVGASGATMLGLVFMTLRVASYAQAKAFYGLALLVPLCLFGAVGWDVLTRGRRVVQGALGALLLVWAMNSFASFWVVPAAPQHVYAGQKLASVRNLDAAAAEAFMAVAADPSSAAAHRFLASVLGDTGRANEALPHARRAIELSPLDGAGYLELGIALARQGELEPAVLAARRAVELGPEQPQAYDLLSFCLSQLGRPEEAMNAIRDGLAVSPFTVELHQALGDLLAESGDVSAAARHFGYAQLLRPSAGAVGRQH